MRKLLATISMVGALALSPIVQAAPLSDALAGVYNAAVAACTIGSPTFTGVDGCTAAINAYNQAAVAAGFPLNEVALSLGELRVEVASANADADPTLVAQIDGAVAAATPSTADVPDGTSPFVPG